MRWARRAFYVLPLLILGGFYLAILALQPFGAECHGRLFEGTYECNDLGDLQNDLFYGGLALTALSVPVWALGMLAMSVRRFLRRRRTQLN